MGRELEEMVRLLEQEREEKMELAEKLRGMEQDLKEEDRLNQKLTEKVGKLKRMLKKVVECGLEQGEEIATLRWSLTSERKKREEVCLEQNAMQVRVKGLQQKLDKAYEDAHVAMEVGLALAVQLEDTQKRFGEQEKREGMAELRIVAEEKTGGKTEVVVKIKEDKDSASIRARFVKNVEKGAYRSFLLVKRE